MIELIFANDTALACHSNVELQNLVDKFSSACKEFGLTISISKTQVLSMSMEVPNMAVDGQRLEAVNHFTNLGSTVSSNLSLDKEIDH